MAIVYIVRHGRAAASFTDDLDPGLDDLGRQQALAACQTLAELTPLELRSSPLKRAVETGAPLAAMLDQPLVPEHRFAEIPSPGLSLEARGPWLRQVMQGNWHQQSDALTRWYEDLVNCLKAIKVDTAIFSHFVAINAAVGAAEQSDRVLMFRPDNGSITRIEVDNGSLSLIERGAEASTHIN